jgi:hypothetical protein
VRSRGAEDRVELGGQVVGVLAAGRVIGGEREDLANRDAQRIAGEIVQALGTPVGPDVHAIADGARPRQIAGLCALWGLPGQSGWLPPDIAPQTRTEIIAVRNAANKKLDKLE